MTLLCGAPYTMRGFNKRAVSIPQIPTLSIHIDFSDDIMFMTYNLLSRLNRMCLSRCYVTFRDILCGFVVLEINDFGVVEANISIQGCWKLTSEPWYQPIYLNYSYYATSFALVRGHPYTSQLYFGCTSYFASTTQISLTRGRSEK